MKKFFSLFAAVLFAGSIMAADATMAAGTNGSACTVNGVDGIKCGTSKAGGDMTITVGAGATKLSFYAAAWKGVTGLSLNLAADGVTFSPASVSLTADDGISNNTPFTLAGSAEAFKFEVELTGVTAETTIAVTSSATKRFVVWGASYETGEVPPTPSVATPVISGDVEFTDSVIVTITCSTPETDIYYTTDGITDPKCDCAAAPEYTHQIVLKETTTIMAAAYTGNDWSAVATKTFTKKEAPVAISCLEVYQKAKNDAVLLNPVTVTYSNGANVWVMDGSASMLIYLPSGFTNNFNAGDVLTGVAGVVDIYQNIIYEVKPDAAQAAAIVATPGEAPAPSQAAVIEASDVNKYVILPGFSIEGEFTADAKTSLPAVLGENTVTIYNNFKFAYTFEAGKTYDITGVVSAYKGNPQVYFISAVEVDPTAIDNTNIDAKAVKFFENGQLIIIKNGVRYNAQGAVVR